MTAGRGAVYILIGLSCLLSITTLILLLSRRKSSAGSQDSTLQTIAAGIEELQRIFTVPYMRGGIGETLLGEVLANWLPPKSYELQYSFQSGARADAVIFFGKYKIAIDAKFPLEAVKRSIDRQAAEGGLKTDTPVPPDVRRAFLTQVKEISGKYIKPAEGTLQFALMYIPSERVYYHTFVEKDTGLLAESLRHGVVPVSPSGIFLYIQTVAYGLRGLDIPEGQKKFHGKSLPGGAGFFGIY